MSNLKYQVLARKYRPATFDDLIGQDVLVQTLTNALNNNRLAHAYLLTGLRGIGKTTTARILAKAFNCLGESGDLTQPTARPCGVCANCAAIAEDRHVDVTEMDAASHTGVDNIRENIIAGIAYKPTQARFKVFIIDEVHMLSKGAFNALLKTLEEPPAHVKFIFATTDVQKLPVTVLSRCQRFNLPRLDQPQLAEHLRNIAEKEGRVLAPDAALLLADAAEGSVRDGLSLLDQAIALATKEVDEIDQNLVQSMLGIGDKQDVYKLFQSIMRGEVANALEQAKQHYKSGIEPKVILAGLQHINHLTTRIKVVPDTLQGHDLTQVDKQHLPELAEKLAIPVLTRAWQLLLKGQEEIAQAMQPFAALEMIIIRVCYVQEVFATPPKGGQPIEQPTSYVKAIALDNGINAALQASPQPEVIAEQKIPLEINSFEDIIEVIKENKDRLLAWHLENQVCLQKFTKPEVNVKGYLKLSTLPEALPGIGIKLQKSLRQYVNQDWQVEVQLHSAVVDNAETMQQQRQKQQQQILDNACQAPLIIRAKELFPDAKIETPMENL